MAVVENLQREDLNYFEEAECYKALLDELKLTQEELASRLGKSQSFIANKLRILKLSPEVREAVGLYGLSERHARARAAPFGRCGQACNNQKSRRGRPER